MKSVETTALIDNIGEDNSLSPAEKETVVRWSKDMDPDSDLTKLTGIDVAWIYTEEAGIARRLLKNPPFVAKELRVNTDAAVGKRVDPESYMTGRITGVGGYIPVGAVKIKQSVRSSSGHAAVVGYRNR